MTATALSGVHHVVLTVTDLDASVEWYVRVLGLKRLIPIDTEDFRRQLLGHSSGMIVGLTEHRRATGAGFDETRPGLDHLSFGVPSREELDEWVERFDGAGVSHSGVKVSPATGFTLVAFRDPDQIQLELYLAPPAG